MKSTWATIWHKNIEFQEYFSKTKNSKKIFEDFQMEQDSNIEKQKTFHENNTECTFIIDF